MNNFMEAVNNVCLIAVKKTATQSKLCSCRTVSGFWDIASGWLVFCSHLRDWAVELSTVGEWRWRGMGVDEGMVALLQLILGESQRLAG